MKKIIALLLPLGVLSTSAVFNYKFAKNNLKNSEIITQRNIYSEKNNKNQGSNIIWPTTGGDVVLEKDENLNDTWYISEGVTNLYLNGHVLSVDDGNIMITGSAVLNIYDGGEVITHKYRVDETNHVWVLDNDGENTIVGGVIYDNSKSVNRSLIATYSSAKLTINGGTICGSRARAISSANFSTITMNGGSISGNCCDSDGGAIDVGDNSSFILTDGLISENYAILESDGGGGAIHSGGDANLTINGGKITKNKCTGPIFSWGGAIYSDGNVTINGGEISYNEIISDTEQASGGGIAINPNYTTADLVMNDGLITHNIAKNLDATKGYHSYGGGISATTFHLHGGEISYNEAEYNAGINSSSDDGEEENYFEVTEGKELRITNNIAYDNGGAGLHSKNNHFSGKIIFENNNSDTGYDNLYSRYPITISGPLTGSNIYFIITTGGEIEAIKNYVAMTGSEQVNEYFHFEEEDGTRYTLIENGSIWIKNVPGGHTTHHVTLEDSTGGNITANLDDAFVGQTITVEVNPNQCHKLKSLTYDDGTIHDITNTKTFEMPDVEVKIAASFVESHSIKLIKGKKPTATEPGWKDYYQCSECKKYYEDEKGTKEIKDLEAWKVGEGKLDPTGPDPEPSSGISTGIIAGIAAGGVVALGGLIWLIIVLAKKKKKKDDEQPVAKSTISKPVKTVKPTQKAKPVSKAKTTTKKTSRKKK
ncbi:MAG: hypothetical protein MJ214_05675 [Bacilli bacterium]|nr:hypothetical protein [Bacilli bacterium]